MRCPADLSGARNPTAQRGLETLTFDPGEPHGADPTIPVTLDPTTPMPLPRDRRVTWWPWVLAGALLGLVVGGAGAWALIAHGGSGR